MDIQLIIFVSSQVKKNASAAWMKIVESDFRPVVGDIIDDPGFDERYHNGYEVVKVTVNYAEKLCYVSLAPLVPEKEDMDIEDYFKMLKANGWQTMKKE